MRLLRFQGDKFGALRKRMIAETELGLLVGLRFPEYAPRIPAIRVGTGTFGPEFAARFWAEALGIDMAELESVERAYLECIGSAGYSGQSPVFHCRVAPTQRRQ